MRALPRGKSSGAGLARWTGYITVQSSGDYTFYLGSDDGSQLLLGLRMVCPTCGLSFQKPLRRAPSLKNGLFYFFLLFLFVVVVFLRHAFPPTSCCKRSVPNRQGDPWVMLTTKRTFADGRAARVSCYLSAHLRLAEHPIKASLPPHTLVGLQLSLVESLHFWLPCSICA